MTNLTVGADAITYTFPAGTNNGKISSQTDSISGETVTYQYDSLNRLLSAAGSRWSETYGYDGFGNLVSKAPTGGAPTLSQAVNAATNQIVGQSYDANGNQTSSPLGPLVYDAENRMTGFANGSTQYGYDSRNKRIWKATLMNGNMTQEVYFYGVDGQKLGTYPLGLASNGPGVEMTNNNSPTLAVFFGGKRVGITTGGSTSAFVADRLGSAGKFYPYGEARGTPLPNDQVKFATYTRDSATGLDYADQRYYASNFGRFMSPDPYRASGGPSDPGSWNRYTYTRGDPANRFDPSGRGDCNPDDPECANTLDPLDSLSSSARSLRQILFGDHDPSHAYDNLNRGRNLLDQVLGGAIPKPCQDDLNALKDIPEMKFSDGEVAPEVKISVAQIIDIADATANTWFDGTHDYAPAYELFAPGDPNYALFQRGANSNLTVSDYFARNGQTRGITPLPGADLNGYIFYDPGYINSLSTQQAAAFLMHELLHTFGAVDAQVQNALGLPTSRDTENISRKLYQDCFSKAKLQ